MPEFKRVRDKITGTHYTTAWVDPERHQVLKQDPLDSEGRPRPAKYKTTPASASGPAREATNRKANEAKEDTP